MELIYIKFNKVSDKVINASLSVYNENKARHIFEIEGVSRKQCAYNFCKKGIVSWDLFDQLKEMADAEADPRFCKVTRYRQSRAEAREERLADICDDLRCSPYEAERFLSNNEMPRNW
jgi:hypothetical protein